MSRLLAGFWNKSFIHDHMINHAFRNHQRLLRQFDREFFEQDKHFLNKYQVHHDLLGGHYDENKRLNWQHKIYNSKEYKDLINNFNRDYKQIVDNYKVSYQSMEDQFEKDLESLTKKFQEESRSNEKEIGENQESRNQGKQYVSEVYEKETRIVNGEQVSKTIITKIDAQGKKEVKEIIEDKDGKREKIVISDNQSSKQIDV